MFSNNFLPRAAQPSPARLPCLAVGSVSPLGRLLSLPVTSLQGLRLCPALSRPGQPSIPLRFTLLLGSAGDDRPSFGHESWFGLMCIHNRHPRAVTGGNRKTCVWQTTEWCMSHSCPGGGS